MRSLRPRPLLAVLFLACACTSTATPSAEPGELRAEIVDEVTLAAQVTALDPARRALTLRREDGTDVELLAGPELRNYAQIALGDTLRVRYQERLSALRLPEGSEATPIEASFAAGRAAEGELPAGAIGLAVRLRVRIESIDEPRAIVVFSTASGHLIARRLRTPEGRAFVADLRVGDLVQLDYSERLALGVDRL